MDVFAMDTIIGCDEGLFHKFDFDKDFAPAPDGTPASEDFLTLMPNKCAVGNVLYSWTWAYNTNNVEGTPKTIKDFLGRLIEWRNLDDLIPQNFRNGHKYKRTGKAGIFAGSLELVKEGSLKIKQDNLFEDIYIKENT